jgi:hypothetical protein
LSVVSLSEKLGEPAVITRALQLTEELLPLNVPPPVYSTEKLIDVRFSEVLSSLKIMS